MPSSNELQNVRIMVCSKDSSDWASTSTVPLRGEICVEWTGTGDNLIPKAKIGDGTHTYAQLPYATLTQSEIQTLINQSAYSLPTASSDTLGGVKIGTNINISSGKISAKSNVDGVDGTTVNRYGTCSTAAATATKIVNITSGNFTLTAGARVTVNFTNANTADSLLKLNVNSTGAKDIYYQGQAIDINADHYRLLKGVVDFIYDGTRWNLMGQGDDTQIQVGAINGSSTSYGTLISNGAIVFDNAQKTQYIDETDNSIQGIKVTLNNASTTANGLMSYQDKVKLNGIDTGADVNQNAFSTIAVKANASATAENVNASAETDTLELIAGSNISLSADTTNKKITINSSASGANVDGVSGSTITRYGVCSTAGDTAAKTVSVTSGSFTLTTGARVTVKFANFNTANQPTLNVNSTGAKNIYDSDGQIYSGEKVRALSGVCDFVYDGTQWYLIDSHNDYFAVSGEVDSSYKELGHGGSLLINEGTITNTSSSANQVAISIRSGSASQTGLVQLSNTIDTNTSKAATPSAVKTYVDERISASDAMVFKGTLGTNGTVTTVPTTGVTKGDTYKVITAGTWATYSCKVGDLIIALNSGDIPASATNWAYVPSGNENETTIRKSSDGTGINLETSAATGDIVLGNAAEKMVDTSITAGTSSTNVPTAAAVSNFVAGATANQANTLTTPRQISITGGATAAGTNFDGSANIALEVTRVSTSVLAVPTGDTLILNANF